MNAKISLDFTLPPYTIKEEILMQPQGNQAYLVALWIAQPNVLNDMRYRPTPTPPQKVISEYIKLGHFPKKKMNDEPGLYVSFWKDKDVVSYYDQREEVRSQNWRNLKELKWARSILEDEELKQRITETINGFIDIEDHPEPINVGADKHWQD